MQNFQTNLKRIIRERSISNKQGRAFVWALPILWITIFFILPFLNILKISFTESIFAAPPYTELVQWAGEKVLAIKINLQNYYVLFEDNLYVSSYIRSLSLGAVATFFCLLIGYPMAYGIARSSPERRNLFLLLIILPFWTSFLIRVYAWIGLLSNKGIINQILLYLGVIESPLPLLYNAFSVVLGIVYSYLPFMILPLFAAIQNIDETYLEAAADLGAKPFKAFRKVTLPLSLSGIFAGCILVFIPAVGEFVIPELLGGPESLMIGRVLWMEFFNNQDWPMASAIAVALLIFLVIPIILLQRIKIVSGHNS